MMIISSDAIVNGIGNRGVGMASEGTTGEGT